MKKIEKKDTEDRTLILILGHMEVCSSVLSKKMCLVKRKLVFISP